MFSEQGGAGRRGIGMPEDTFQGVGEGFAISSWEKAGVRFWSDDLAQDWDVREDHWDADGCCFEYGYTEPFVTRGKHEKRGLSEDQVRIFGNTRKGHLLVQSMAIDQAIEMTTPPPLSYDLASPIISTFCQLGQSLNQDIVPFLRN